MSRLRIDTSVHEEDDIGARVTDLVSPAGIAIVGASESRYYAANVLRNLQSGGYPAERIFPVNPRRETVAGLRCYPDLESIGEPVDLAVVVTRASLVASVIAEAGKAGVHSAVVCADGFAEQGPDGRRRQQELSSDASKARVRVMGPNTMGFLVPHLGTNAWASGGIEDPIRQGGIGMVFQSSGMLNLALALAGQRGLGLRAAFSVGNEVGFDCADFIEYLAADPGTSVICSLMEGATRPRRLVRALQAARDAGKPVIMLKLGLSERARQSAASHTGRMVSSGDAWNAVLQRLGVVQVRDLDELMNTVSLFDTHGKTLAAHSTAGAAGVALMAISGGDCGLLCDLAEDKDLPLAALSADTLAGLREIFSKPDLLGNPLDCENLHKENFGEFGRAVDLLFGDRQVDIIAARMNLPVTPTKSARALYEYLAEKARSAGKSFVVLSRANEALSPDWYEFFRGIGVPFVPAYGPSLAALAALARWPERRMRWSAQPTDHIPEVTQVAGEGSVLSWQETQEILASAGVPYAPAALLSPGSPVRLPQQLSFPVAAKLVSAELPHKSDVGAVVLGIADESELQSAVERLMEIAAGLGVVPEGVEVQSMAGGVAEMLAGVVQDASLGPVIAVGMGGTRTEIDRDVAMMTAPLTSDDAHRLIGELRGGRVLDGYRGHSAADTEALVEALVSISAYAVTPAADGLVLEFNPILVGPAGQGLVAVDALALARSCETERAAR